jgi:hypothetical protein
MSAWLNRSERGAAAALTALALFALVGASAIAVDLAALRADRSADQRVTDIAASAGLLAAAEGGAGAEACEAALGYANVNAGEIGSLDDSGCAAAFSSSCDPLFAESHTVTSGRFTVTVVYPVPDDHGLMDSGLLGAGSQPVVTEDGEPCERFAVEISALRDGVFSQLLGFDQGATTVHTVATTFFPDGDGLPINLLVLDRFGCETIDVQGNGGIVVEAVVNETNTGLVQGVAASDSDGTAGCSADGVIDIDGSNSVLRADGPEGCSNQTGTGIVGGFTSGDGCGVIATFANGVGCSPPACTRSGGNLTNPNPLPSRLPVRLTRAPVDHRYNCWPDYTTPPAGVGWASDPLTTTNQQDIPGCIDGTPDHIYDLINSVGQNGSAGYTDWTSLGYPCDIPSSSPSITVGGNVRIDCADFTVRVTVNIDGGNVIFDGNVNVTGGTGHLNIQNTLASPGWAFFRDGTLAKSGDASLTINNTAAYMSKTSRVAMAGGDGTLTWIAPNSGNFDDLALWSDSPLQHDWAGQAGLTMEGIFFMPQAHVEYSGNGGQNQTRAQWVADKLTARGQGQLLVSPAFGRAVEFPINPQTILIR